MLFDIPITTAEGVVVEYKETGNVKDDIAQLSQSPGLEWMGELANRDDVNWQAVQEVHDQWKIEDSGIGGPGMQLVSLAMAVALSLTPGGQGFATGVLGMAEGSTMTAAVAAGFNSLVLQAGMQVVQNGGDIGAALEALASIETVRSLATAMLAAGLTKGFTNLADGKDFLTGKAAADAANAAEVAEQTTLISELADKLQDGAIGAGVNTGVGTAINGGDLGENLVANMHGAAVSVLGAKLANEIGAAYKNGNGDLDYVSHKIAHAALGGAMDLASGGDGISGAIGGVAGEITGDILANEIRAKYDAGEITIQNLVEWQGRGVNISRLVAGFAAAAAGGDVDAGAKAGGNAAENNAWQTMLIKLYIEHVGEGYSVKGLATIGNGEDPLSQGLNNAIEKGITETVHLAHKVCPEATEEAVQMLVDLDGTIDATLSWVDDQTGQIVSRSWSSMSHDEQGLVKLAGLTISFSSGAIGALAKLKKVQTVAKAVDKVIPDSVKNSAAVKALAEGTSSIQTAIKAYKHKYKYGPRIRERALDDPVGHNFPYSFDDEILATKPIPHSYTDGRLLYRKQGTLNGKSGVYEIALDPNKELIFHRVFRKDN